MAQSWFLRAWLLVGLACAACSAEDLSYLQRDLGKPIDAGAADGGAPAGGVSGGGGSPGGGGSGDGGTTSTGGAGIRDAGICWYFGELGASCAATCTDHGGPSPQAASHVGIESQGGSLDECIRLLGLLGMTGTVYSGSRSDGQGLGCHVIPGDLDPYFLAFVPGVQRHGQPFERTCRMRVPAMMVNRESGTPVDNAPTRGERGARSTWGRRIRTGQRPRSRSPRSV